MKKSEFKNYPFGSAEYVVLHAQHKMRRGKNPSMSFRDQKNPRKALKDAKLVAKFPRKFTNPKKDTVMYEVIISLEPIGQYESFKTAYFKFIEEIKTILKQGSSWQWLETMNFLVRIDPSGSTIPMPFYEARDFAFDVGLMKKDTAEIQPDAIEPTAEIVLQAYHDYEEQMGFAQLQELGEMIGKLHKQTMDLKNELQVW